MFEIPTLNNLCEKKYLPRSQSPLKKIEIIFCNNSSSINATIVKFGTNMYFYSRNPNITPNVL